MEDVYVCKWKKKKVFETKKKDVHECRPPGKVLTVKLGQYKLETMLEWYQGFISANKICF